VGDGLIAFWSNWPSKKQKDASNGLAFPHRLQVKIINYVRALKLIHTVLADEYLSISYRTICCEATVIIKKYCVVMVEDCQHCLKLGRGCDNKRKSQG